jgi:predicted secreted hydrolase
MHDEDTPDLRGRPELENEWWYYHGHLAGGGRRFGFHLVFFRRSTERIRIGSFFPVKLVSRHMRYAHFGLVDIDRQEFRYGHQRSILPTAGEATERFQVWMRRWSAGGTSECHRLACAIRGVRLELELKPTKPAVKHGLTGFRTGENGQQALYFSYSRMQANGRIVVEGEELNVSGEAWMDRDYGGFTFDRHNRGWDWFAIQFDNGRELMVFHMRDQQGRQSEHSLATLIEADGAVVHLPPEAIDVQTLRTWCSPVSGSKYPVEWCICLAPIDAELRVAAVMREPELDTRGSTCLYYWEGPTAVSGNLSGQNVQGRGYLEMVGYDEPGGFGIYDFETDNLGLCGWLVNEYRLRVFGPGVVKKGRVVGP